MVLYGHVFLGAALADPDNGVPMAAGPVAGEPELTAEAGEWREPVRMRVIEAFLLLVAVLIVLSVPFCFGAIAYYTYKSVKQ